MTFFRSKAESEPKEDSELDDGDCFGVLVGDASTEVEDDEGTDSTGFVSFCRALVRGARIVDMVKGKR